MNVLQSLLFDEVCQKRILRGVDVRAIKRLYADNETVCQTEIAALLTINQACFVQDPSWADFLVEALTTFVVKEMEPAGTVTAENAEWLISAIAPSGLLTSHRLRECVVQLMQQASAPPRVLRSFLLQTVQSDLVAISGATASLLSRRPEAFDNQITALATVVFGNTASVGLQLSRADLDVVRAIDRITTVSGSATWARFVEALAAVTLLELGDHAMPEAAEVVAFIAQESARPWEDQPIGKLSEAALQLRGLERQRASILVGEVIKTASVVDLEAAWGGLRGYTRARRSLADAGYDIPTPTGARAVRAA